MSNAALTDEEKQAWEQPCVDESCDRDELHPAHAEVAARGRMPRTCPRCFGALTRWTCASCGWARVKEQVPAPAPASASPWVDCPQHGGLFCVKCSGVGVVPRLRLYLLLAAG